MIVLAAMLLGAIFGGWRAWRRKGNRLDIAQYAGVYLILFGLIGMVLTIVLQRIYF
ncbi:apolipoprotein acyltransferase [Solirhodobacter olei]|uniref:apolipoprotein acyltransferase n=1 Tax=Solirhodobacter olei TaxID=2493082 RepID=UPI000FDC46CE|nr:apolipoprotein acyltransferase [Solirhodobacter olei]